MVPRSSNNLTPLNRSETFALTAVFSVTALFVWAVLIAFFLFLLYSSSHLAVPHNIHAVEITYGFKNRYIHGGKLNCEVTQTQHHCQIVLNNKLLDIVALSTTGAPADSIGDCSATFGGHEVSCKRAWLTTDNWPRGVTIRDEPALKAAQASWLKLLTWKTMLLDRDEDSMILVMRGIGIGIACFAAFGSMNLSKRWRCMLSELSWRWRLITPLFLCVLLSLVGVSVLFIALLEMLYID